MRDAVQQLHCNLHESGAGAIRLGSIILEQRRVGQTDCPATRKAGSGFPVTATVPRRSTIGICIAGNIAPTNLTAAGPQTQLPKETKQMTLIVRLALVLTIVLILMVMPTVATQVLAGCLDGCDAQYTTCQNGCRNISDPGQAKSCVDGCFRGYEGCKRRCSASSENLELPGDAVRLWNASDGPSQWLDSGGSPGKVIPVCVQPPIQCGSNNDCACSHCCAPFGATTVCQPSC